MNQIRKVGIEDALQRFAQGRVISPDRENTKAAQKVEIADALPIVQYCPSPRQKPTSYPMVLRTRTICSLRWRACMEKRSRSHCANKSGMLFAICVPPSRDLNRLIGLRRH